jgi:N-acyl-D-aspartate/D-glutamate deacylase
MHDLVIKSATIIDGTGAAGFSGDVAVTGGRIVEIGKVSGPAKRTINAAGATITPGFVDIHTHYDGQVSWDSLLAPSSTNGVTSIAMGNCGVGFAPTKPEKHDWLIALLEGVEDIPGTALAEGLSWDWESFPDYLDALSRRRFTMDVGGHVPHAALRAYVMGEKGADHTCAPSEAEIARMQQLTFEALEAGALGFSTSRTYVHRSRDGTNIGTLTASEQELLGIAGALKRSGKGVIQLISDAYLTPDDAFAGRELKLIRALAKLTGRKLSFTVQETDDAPERWRGIFAEIDAMVADGLDVRAQVAPRPIGAILSFASTTNPFVATPTYRALLSLPRDARLARLGDPDVKAKILAEHAPLNYPGFAGLLFKGFDRMFRMTDPVDYEPSADASLKAEAARTNHDPASYVYDVLLEEGGKRLLYMPLINYALGNLNAVHDMMTSPRVLFGLSDGGAHCGTISDGSFPTTTLGLWSKGSKSGRRIPLEALVHGYTQRNAVHVGWHDRGVVAPGYVADLNVLVPEDLTLSPPVIAHDLPAGGSRLLQHGRGYRYTIKSGVVTFENGKWTGEEPGRLLRGEQRL